MNLTNSLNVSPSANEFISSVLQLRPQLAVFDCDGTLWSGDAGEGFFSWEIERGLLADDISRWAVARYADYRAGKVSEDDMCGEMVTIHAGLGESEIKRAAAEYFDATFPTRIFPEMRELIARLMKNGCEVWAVSSTNGWVIRHSMRYFGIPPQNVLAAEVEIDGGIVTNRLIRIPSGEGKPKAIREVIRRDPDLVFGNSRWDVDMLKIAGHPYAINPNPDLEALADRSGWTIYWPEGTRKAARAKP